MKVWLRFLLGLWLVFFGMTFTLPANAMVGAAETLSSEDRFNIRYHLENLFNEMNLLIKNEKVDKKEIDRQEQLLRAMKVYERIPFERDIEGLKKELDQSSQASHLRLVDVGVRKITGVTPQWPKRVYTDDRNFQVKPDDGVETLRLEIVVAGDEESVQQWVKGWPEAHLRWVEPVGKCEKKGQKQWKVSALAYRFKKLVFPILIPRDPRAFLPGWAKKDPAAFSKAEPVLAHLVQKIDQLKPNMAPYYLNRGRYLMNDARLNFFYSKVKTDRE